MQSVCETDVGNRERHSSVNPDKKIEVRRSQIIDNFTLKKEDADEVWNSHHLLPSEAIEISLGKSFISFTVVIDNSPSIIFGINPVSILGDSAVLFLLSDVRIKDIGYRFVRHSREYVDYFLSFYKHLFNYVSVDSRTTIAWLRRIGAKFYDLEQYGVEGKLFRKFCFDRT